MASAIRCSQKVSAVSIDHLIDYVRQLALLRNEFFEPWSAAQPPVEFRIKPNHLISGRRPRLSNPATTESRSAAPTLSARAASSSMTSGQSPG